MRIRRESKIALVVFAIFYVVFGLLLAIFQEKVVYQPNSQDFNNCAELKDAKHVTVGDTRMYYKDNGPRVAVLYHGNAGSACDRAFYASMLQNMGYSYILPEYTGYSDDIVSPGHDVIKKNAQDVIRYLHDNKFTNVVIIGESIGTGVASYHSSLAPQSKLILISPFTNLVDIARHRFWFYPVSLLVQNAFDNVQLLSKYQGPVLILHGDQDSLIPENLGQELFSSLQTQNKKLVVVQGAGHNNMFDFPDTPSAITSFLNN